MNRRNITVLLAAVAVLVVPLGAMAGRSNSSVTPLFFGGGLSGPTYVERGTTVIYNYQVAGRAVKTLRLSLVLPRQMQLLTKGSPHFTIVGGKPTWVMKYLNNFRTNKVRGFNFAVFVKTTAVVKSKYIVMLREKAQTGKWVKLNTTQINARVTTGQ